MGRNTGEPQEPGTLESMLDPSSLDANYDQQLHALLQELDTLRFGWRYEIDWSIRAGSESSIAAWRISTRSVLTALSKLYTSLGQNAAQPYTSDDVYVQFLQKLALLPEQLRKQCAEGQAPSLGVNLTFLEEEAAGVYRTQINTLTGAMEGLLRKYPDLETLYLF